MRVLIIAMLLVSGCSKAKPQIAPIAPTVQVSHEAQVYAELWKVCKEKGFSYQVQDQWAATGDNRGSHYWAIAYDTGHFPIFITHADGPTEAAEKLFETIRNKYEERSTFDTGEVKP